MERFYSLIVPVYNRPGELAELLESMTRQSFSNFEVIIVEDGSVLKSDELADRYHTSLNIRYYYKSNTGPGQSRNFGCDNAAGDYLVFLDSDCVLPPAYLEIVNNFLDKDYADAFGGPDKADDNFTELQKAINYAMTSFLTTGGIRGGGEKLDKFYPRSFNMGYSKEVYSKLKGFSGMRFGEDIDMSIRIIKAGFTAKLIRDAFVYHRRRTNLKQFFKQVYNSGIARVNLFTSYPESLKAVHLLPSFFVIGMIVSVLLSISISVYFLGPVLLFTLLLFLDSSLRNRNIRIGLWSIPASYFQIIGYGSGFIEAFVRQIFFRQKEFSAFTGNFYK